jgi:hypothetical protein
METAGRKEGLIMVRYTMELDDSVDATLKALAKAKETTKSDIIKRALASYAYLSNQILPSKLSGATTELKVSLTDKQDKVVKDVVLP